MYRSSHVIGDERLCIYVHVPEALAGQVSLQEVSLRCACMCVCDGR